jgi:chemotaxis response regulator CheB
MVYLGIPWRPHEKQKGDTFFQEKTGRTKAGASKPQGIIAVAPSIDLPAPKERPPFVIVCLGASAGGLETLEQGFKIVGKAVDGHHAIKMTDQTHPDVILMDINMPNMNGLEATQAISKRYPSIKILGLSSP